jgi:hypothetical protein
MRRRSLDAQVFSTDDRLISVGDEGRAGPSRQALRAGARYHGVGLTAAVVAFIFVLHSTAPWLLTGLAGG